MTTNINRLYNRLYYYKKHNKIDEYEIVRNELDDLKINKLSNKIKLVQNGGILTETPIGELTTKYKKKKNEKINTDYTELLQKYNELLKKQTEKPLNTEYNELLDKYTELFGSNNILLKKYDDLINGKESPENSKYTELLNKYTELLNKEQEEIDKYNILNDKYKAIQSHNNIREQQFKNLKLENTEYFDEIKNLKSELDKHKKYAEKYIPKFIKLRNENILLKSESDRPLHTAKDFINAFSKN